MIENNHKLYLVTAQIIIFSVFICVFLFADYPQLLRHSFSEPPSTLMKDNKGPTPNPVQPADSGDSEHHRSNQTHQVHSENQQNTTDRPTDTEAYSPINGSYQGDHQPDQQDVSLPRSSCSDDPMQTPPEDVPSPSQSNTSGTDINCKQFVTKVPDLKYQFSFYTVHISHSSAVTAWSNRG